MSAVQHQALQGLTSFNAVLISITGSAHRATAKSPHNQRLYMLGIPRMAEVPFKPSSPPFLTFLFTDIESSVRLMEQHPQAMPRALARHDALVRGCVAQHGGRVVKTTGDGVHAVFEQPLDALQTALALQLALADPEATHGLPLRVRCGLHGGFDEARDGDYFGPAVNRAARIMGIAHGGQTLLSQAVAERVAAALPDGISLHDLGRVRLRDLGSPERVHQLQHSRLRDTFPPLRSLEATPNNLAQQLDSFVGRQQEVAEVRALLGQSRQVTLLGMGGIGKSRLSVQLGAEVLDEYIDGVWLVEFAPLTDPRLVPQAVASVLGVKEDAGRGITESLLQHVRDRQMLLIFDNCEHLVHDCAALAKALLQAGAGVRLLASSRTVLQLAGEATYQVPTLGVPGLQSEFGRGEAADTLGRHDAVRLFVDRAVAAQSPFRLTPANAAAVADICRRLDGIPLAIELAAARIRALSAEAISQRLNDRFKLLVTGDQTVLPRQRTLRALIDWSHDLLSEPERTLFRRLAVFAGGWTLEAAEAVCAGDGLDAADVLDLQTSLVEKSLVVMEAGGARYRMLDTVQHFAAEKLSASDDESNTRNRHLSHYVDYAETARPALGGPEQGAWQRRLDAERENFLTAHRWSAKAPQGDELGLRLMHALRPYWIRSGAVSLGLRMAQDTLQHPGLRPRRKPRCMALFGVGQLSYLAGLHEQAKAHLGECLSIANEIGDDDIVARVLQPLGMVLAYLREYDAATLHLQQALALARAQGDAHELGCALTALAILHRLEQRPDLAAPLCTEAVTLSRGLDDQQNTGIALLNLAMVSITLHQLDAARGMLLEVIDLAERSSARPLMCSVAEVCSGLAAVLQDWHAAAAFFGDAEAQQHEAGQRRDPTDEAFLAPLIEATQKALGAVAFDASQALGRQRAQQDSLQCLRDWLLARSDHQLFMGGSST